MALRRLKKILSPSKNRPESPHGNTTPTHSVVTTNVYPMDRIDSSTRFSGTTGGNSTAQTHGLATAAVPLSDPAVLHTSGSAAGALSGAPPGDADSSDANSDAGANGDVRKYFEAFRILIMGRANAGKTTILQRVCATTEQPEIFDGNGNKINMEVIEGSIERGEHSIENGLIFSSNPGFIFHDSCGFEAGSVDEFNKMKDFVLDRATTSHLKKRIHAIWYCIPVTDYNRPIVAAEIKFFQECDTKKVPVLVLLTKLDTLASNAYNELKNEGCSKERARELRKSELGRTQFPPKNYVQLTNMHENNADSRSLLEMTATALDEVALQLLLVSTQQTNLHLCVEWAVKMLSVHRIVQWHWRGYSFCGFHIPSIWWVVLSEII
ncbi:hypothetical protein SCLCIDRAFT_236985 [Scleroderma citrinum Foug A]|uniref:Uncharacterized protein n=1 Tax=Scleroderma citrinum Foug A TaxID=1036808 RepID=A0A0C3DKG6_9AGAM|nr:hypothetical protein SCLCIDRAFT_236985 [Scleroderma citrinum Foug A]